jgi:hypothetical protein
MVSAASGNWKDYCVAGEHMCIVNLFLNKKVKGKVVPVLN